MRVIFRTVSKTHCAIESLFPIESIQLSLLAELVWCLPGNSFLTLVIDSRKAPAGFSDVQRVRPGQRIAILSFDKNTQPQQSSLHPPISALSNHKPWFLRWLCQAGPMPGHISLYLPFCSFLLALCRRVFSVSIFFVHFSAFGRAKFPAILGCFWRLGHSANPPLMTG